MSDTFDELVAQFNISPSSSSPQPTGQFDPTQIRLWLSALSHVVSRLERTHSALVDAIVNTPWTTFDSATVKSYTMFIGMLLSARPEYLSLVLTKIAHGFTYREVLLNLSTYLNDLKSHTIHRIRITSSRCKHAIYLQCPLDPQNYLRQITFPSQTYPKPRAHPAVDPATSFSPSFPSQKTKSGCPNDLHPKLTSSIGLLSRIGR